MKGIFVAILAMAMSACAPTMVRTYDGPKKGFDEISIVKGVYGDFSTKLSEYAMFKPGSKLVYERFNKSGGGSPIEAHMLPGLYVIQVYCYSGNSYAFPKLPLETKAGMTYEVECQYVPDNHAKVRAKMVKKYATSSAPKSE